MTETEPATDALHVPASAEVIRDDILRAPEAIVAAGKARAVGVAEHLRQAAAEERAQATANQRQLRQIRAARERKLEAAAQARRERAPIAQQDKVKAAAAHRSISGHASASRRSVTRARTAPTASGAISPRSIARRWSGR